MESESAVMTVSEAARALRVSRNSAYEYVQRGFIPHVRLGGRILIPRDRFERWLAGTDEAGGSVREKVGA